MATEDNLRDRAKEIRGAFEPSSVTNEAVGGLLLDIINFFIDYGGNGGGGGKPDARYWSKEELKMLDQYLYVLNDKIKALYADSAGDSELFKGHKWEDYFDQPLHTYDPVKFNSVTSTDFESKLKGWIIDALGNAEFRDVLLRSFKSWNFAAGPLGAGVGMVNDDELQTDKLLVRKIMYVLEMMIQRMRFQGGIMVLSPATGFKIDRVETFDTYYRVYCRPEDFNEFEVNDQARIQNFTGNNIKYLWSLVLSRGDDYIDISRVDKDGDGVPAEGDEIVQLGNRTNQDRQDAVLLSAVNGEVGIFTYYGINSFDLSSKEGSWLGKHGGKKGAVIRGEVHITAGSSGLEQFDEYEDVDKRIQDAKDLADSVQDVVNNLTSIIIPDIQGQIDGSIMSHEGKVPPTLTNEPAVNWTTEEEKNRHLGDYYDYFLTVDGEQVTERYKFSKVNGTYQWLRVADSGSALAASVAREALGLAGTKATITWGNTLPEAPYNINDMWIKLDGSMYICNHQRLDGETGSQSDWQLFNDTMLRLAKMADDNVITKEEKATLRDTWNQIQKEFTAYQAQATKYGVSITALQNAYNTLNTFLTNTVKIAQDIDSNLSVAQKTEYNQDFANYYSERTAFANVIAQKVADESVGNLQIGMVNLLKGSNVELNRQQYSLGTYFYDTIPEVGKTYTIVMCYTLGENNTHINVFQDYGNNFAANFNTRGNRVIESKSFKFTIENTIYMGFVQFPNGTYGSKVHWAVLVEGNKGPNAWIPSLSEQGQEAAKDAVDNLQIGAVNLVSRKMLLNINNTNGGSAIWGQDSDGIYISVAPKDNTTLYSNFKNGTQYVISVNCKGNPSGGSLWRPYLKVEYTDGTMESAWQTKDSVYNRHDYISKQGKTIARVCWNVANGGQTYSNFIYSLALYEGNKVLAEPPVATEDLTGQSNVNLVDGGKEVTVASKYYSTLKVPVLKPNTVYTVRFTNVEVISGDTPSGYEFRLYDTKISANYATVKIKAGDNHGILITSNNFTVPIEGRLLFYPGIQSEGIARSVKYTEIMLVEGFTSPSSYSPSPGDVAKDIKDVSDAVANLNTTINTTFKDGIISEAEAKAIASNINVLNAEKADIDAYYTKLYANAYLTGTAKTNLASAKTAYNTAHTKLIDSINKAIADGKTTATEKADVDDKFTAYNNALFAYQTRVGEADKAIQDTIKKVADDAQTSANTAQSAANAAQSAANQAQADANAANSKLATWASDNYISPQEKTALRQQKSDIQAEYNDIVANANRYNISLTSYSAAYNAAISALNKYTATSPENIAVSSDYNNIAAYYPARQTILNSIAAAAKAQADKATGAIGMDGGKMLYADPEFKKGLNGVAKYTNSSNVSPDYIASKLTVERVAKPSDAPTQSGYCLKITCKAAQSPGYGGVYQSITSRANAVFVQKIIAKIPVGYKINTASNSMGTGYTDTWLTPTEGTGKYTTYLRKVVCGTTGNFGAGGHVYINGSPAPTEAKPLEWYIAYMTAFDMTADGYGDIEFSAKDDLAQQLGYSNFDKMVENAAKGETIIKGAYINTQLIDVETLVADTALVDKLTTRILTTDSITANMISVGGFEFQNGQIYGGSDFGVGPGVKITSKDTERSFKAYKDANNYISMFYNSANDWGLKGVVGGSTVFQLGNPAGEGTFVGPFNFTKTQLVSSSDVTIGSSNYKQGFTLENNKISFNRAVSSIYQRRVEMGVANTAYGSDTLLAVEGGDIWHQGTVTTPSGSGYTSRSCRFYASDIHLRGDMEVYNNSIIRMKGQIHFDNVITYTGSGAVTITADSGHFIYLTPITGNPVVSVSSGLPIGSWFIIAHTTTAGGYYYIKLSGSDRFRRRGNAYQQVNSHNQDPSLIFKVSDTTWIIGNLPVNWIDWN